METVDWQKIKEIFNAAIDLPAAERAKFLAECEPNLRERVENLLKADENAEDFIIEPAFIDAGFTEEDETDFYVGKQIDDYKILKEIGHGGMGTVYLAAKSDETFDKKVAIKLIKRGMDTAAVLKRFVMERKILASLENPHIASLLDGGSTTDGLPYLVMEYIEGEPITKFCDSHRFSIEERLELFRKVCSAISYAHQNLVVHRDIKPSNILITKDGTPKLLDFGIAKLLHPDWSLETTEATATMFRLMTPEYASPEQIRGLTITTTSDVYSLGVVLYELLSGERPYKIESRLPQEVANIILTEEPVKPSAISNFKFQISNFKSKDNTDPNKEKQTNEQTLNPKSKIRNPKLLKGDLDNIILKALRKEPERRYQSVQEFSEDIRRHLIGLPVTATADTTFYRVGKFVKRHRGGVFAGGLVFLTLFAATVVTSWQTIVARRERTRAEQRFNQVRKLANTILFDYHERIKNLPGATETRKKLVTDALEYLDNLAQTSDDSPDLQRELALAYQKVGDIQGGISESANTGEASAALENYRKALTIQENLVLRFPENNADRRTLAKLYNNVGGEDLCRKAVDIFTKLSQKDLQNTTASSDLASALFRLAMVVRANGDYDGAIVLYRQAGEIYEKLALIDEGAEKRGTRLRNAALAYKTIGAVFEQKLEPATALELYRKALIIDTENAAANPNNVQYQLDSSFSYNSIASVLPDFGNFKEAQENCQKALTIQEKVVAEDAKNSFAKFSLARTYRRMGTILQSLEKFEEADPHFRKAIKIIEELVQANPDDKLQTGRQAEFYTDFGDFLFVAAAKDSTQKTARLREAQNYQKRALEIFTILKSQNKLDNALKEKYELVQISLQKTTDELAKQGGK